MTPESGVMTRNAAGGIAEPLSPSYQIDCLSVHGPKKWMLVTTSRVLMIFLLIDVKEIVRMECGSKGERRRPTLLTRGAWISVIEMASWSREQVCSPAVSCQYAHHVLAFAQHRVINDHSLMKRRSDKSVWQKE